MPHSIEFDRSPRRVTIQYEGLVTANEYLHVLDELGELDAVGPDLDGISVFLGAEVEIVPAQVEDVLARLKDRDRFRGRNWAFVIEKPRAAAIGQLYQMAARRLKNVQIWDTVEGAVDWLDAMRDADA